MHYLTTSSSLIAIKPNGDIYAYSASTRRWEKIPPVPTEAAAPVVPRQFEEPTERTNDRASDDELIQKYIGFSDKEILKTYVTEFEPQTDWEVSFMDTMKNCYENNWSISLKQRLSILRGLDKRQLIGSRYDDEDEIPFWAGTNRLLENQQTK